MYLSATAVKLTQEQNQQQGKDRGHHRNSRNIASGFIGAVILKSLISGYHFTLIVLNYPIINSGC